MPLVSVVRGWAVAVEGSIPGGHEATRLVVVKLDCWATCCCSAPQPAQTAPSAKDATAGTQMSPFISTAAQHSVLSVIALQLCVLRARGCHRRAGDASEAACRELGARIRVPTPHVVSSRSAIVHSSSIQYRCPATRLTARDTAVELAYSGPAGQRRLPSGDGGSRLYVWLARTSVGEAVPSALHVSVLVTSVRRRKMYPPVTGGSNQPWRRDPSERRLQHGQSRGACMMLGWVRLDYGRVAGGTRLGSALTSMT